jgi:hypothetical protein
LGTLWETTTVGMRTGPVGPSAPQHGYFDWTSTLDLPAHIRLARWCVSNSGTTGIPRTASHQLAARHATT